jgi:hypothetical protein
VGCCRQASSHRYSVLRGTPSSSAMRLAGLVFRRTSSTAWALNSASYYCRVMSPLVRLIVDRSPVRGVHHFNLTPPRARGGLTACGIPSHQWAQGTPDTTTGSTPHLFFRGDTLEAGASQEKE